MAAPTVFDSNTGFNSGSVTTVVVTLPANASGDVIYISMVSDAPSQVFTAPAGYSTLYSNVATSGGTSTAAVFYKASGGSEPSTVNVTVATSERQAWVAFTVRNDGGVNAQGTNATGSSGTATIPAVTTTLNDCLLIGIVAVDGSGQVISGWSAYSLVQNASPAASGGAIAVFSTTLATAGTQAAEATIALDAPEQWLGLSFAILPQNTSPSISINNTVTITETVAVSPVSFLSVTDAITVTDDLALLLVSLVNINNTVTVTEQVSLVVSAPGASASDTVTVTEQVALLVSVAAGPVTDTVTVTESVTVRIASLISVSDAVTVTESVAALSASNINVTDTATVTDTPILSFGSNISVTDSASVVDAVTINIPIPGTVNVSDSAAVFESVALVIGTNISVTDAITVTDTPVVSIVSVTGAAVNVTDAVTITEALQVAIGDHRVSVTDTVTVTDTPILQISNTQDIQATDTVTLTENISVVIPILILAQENVVLTEQVFVSVPPVISAPFIVDAVQGASNTNQFNTVMGPVPNNIAGDVIYIAISSDAADQIFSPPSGFSVLYDNVAIPTGTHTATFSLFYKQSAGSEPAFYTVAGSIAERQAWITFSVRNDGGIDAQGTNLTGSGITATIPAVTTVSDHCLLIGVIATDAATIPHTGGSTYVEQVEVTASSASTTSLWFSSLAELAGAKPSDAITLDSSEQWLGVSFAIRPAVSPALSVFDLVTLTEQVALLIASGGVSVTEAVSVIEAISLLIVIPGSPQVTDQVTTIEAVTVSVTLQGAQVTDTVTVTESVSVVIASSGTLSISVTDNITVTTQVGLAPSVLITPPDLIDVLVGVSNSNTLATLVDAPSNVSGDVIYIAISSDAANQVFTPPNGFNTLYSNLAIFPGDNAATFAMFYKTSGGVEPGTYTVLGTVAERQAWVAFSVRGDNGINSVGNNAFGLSTLAALPDLRTYVDNCLLVGIVATDGNTTPHTGGVYFLQQGAASGPSASTTSVWFATQSVAGDFASEGITITGAQQWLTLAFAIQPEGVTGVHVSNTITVTEQVTVIIISPGTVHVTETVSVTEQVTVQIVSKNVSVTETITVTEEVSVRVIVPGSPQANDTVTVTETVRVRIIGMSIQLASYAANGCPVAFENGENGQILAMFNGDPTWTGPNHVAIADAGGYFVSDNVEDALQELASALANLTTPESATCGEIQACVALGMDLESGLIYDDETNQFSFSADNLPYSVGTLSPGTQFVVNNDGTHPKGAVASGAQVIAMLSALIATKAPGSVPVKVLGKDGAGVLGWYPYP